MIAIASQIILCLVLDALLGLIIGYIVGKSHCPRAAYKSSTPVDPHTHDDGECGDDHTAVDKQEEHFESTSEASHDNDTGQPQGLLEETTETLLPEAQPLETIVTKAENPETVSHENEVPEEKDKPAGLLNAPEGEKDNLTRIKGIGVKIESQLNEIGVYHFRQIAVFSEKELNWVAHHTSFPGRALRDDWIGQAKLLAEGKETEFSKRVDAGEVSSSHTS
jgi:NADH-quinone oxidoreductase subunit E